MPRQDGSTVSLPGMRRSDASSSPERCGAWILREPLAAGGFGEVFAAEHAEHHETAAVKLLRRELTRDTVAVARFGREAALLQALAMPGVVRVHEFGTDAEGRCFLAMERLSGQDLKQRLRSEGRLGADIVLAILDQAATVLDAAHARSVVHRDIKASNVFLCDTAAQRPRVVLLDFGLAKLIDGSGPELTASREIIGTPASMAPEQILGRRVDARTDVYALGALAFHALTGRAPFEHPSVLGLCQLHLLAAVPSASALAPLGAAVDTVIARAMSKDPEHRFESCGRFTAALSAALDQEPDPVERTGHALALRVRVLADPSELARGDELVWSDFERVLPLARVHLESVGFRTVLRVGNALTAVHDLPDDPGSERSIRAGVVASALRLVSELQRREARHGAVSVEVCLTSGIARDYYAQFAAIDAERDRARDPRALLTRPAVLEGLDLAGTPSSCAGWVELGLGRA